LHRIYIKSVTVAPYSYSLNRLVSHKKVVVNI